MRVDDFLENHAERLALKRLIHLPRLSACASARSQDRSDNAAPPAYNRSRSIKSRPFKLSAISSFCGFRHTSGLLFSYRCPAGSSGSKIRDVKNLNCLIAASSCGHEQDSAADERRSVLPARPAAALHGLPAIRSAAGPLQTMPISRPSPRISFTNGLPASSLVQLRDQILAHLPPAPAPAFSFTSSRASPSPTAVAIGVPPKVVAWLPAYESFGQLRFPQHRADREAAAEAFGQSEDIRLDAVMLISEQLAGASHARLHLIEDEQQIMLIAQLAQLLHECLISRDDAAFRLHELQHDRTCASR